jgi:hypothetical protein
MRRIRFPEIFLLLAVLFAPVLGIMAAEPQKKSGIVLHTIAVPKNPKNKNQQEQYISATKIVVSSQNRVFYNQNYGSIHELKPDGRSVHFSGFTDGAKGRDGLPKQSSFYGIDSMLALADGSILVADNANVRHVDATGNVRTIYTSGSSIQSSLSAAESAKSRDQAAKIIADAVTKADREKPGPRIQGLAVDKNGTIYCTDPADNAIYTLNLAGKLELYTKVAPQDPKYRAAFAPGIAVDTNLVVYVATGNVISKLSKRGPPVPYSLPAKPKATQLPAEITQMQFDAAGNLWVAGTTDQDNSMAFITPDGVVRSLNLGVKDPTLKIKGSGFSFDRDGNLYTAGPRYLQTFPSSIWKARLARP